MVVSASAALTVAAPGVLANDHANGGGAMTAALVSDVSNGTLILGGDGSVSYTPNLGFVGTETFAYRAVNADGGGNVATVTIAVMSFVYVRIARNAFESP